VELLAGIFYLGSWDWFSELSVRAGNDVRAGWLALKCLIRQEENATICPSWPTLTGHLTVKGFEVVEYEVPVS
jgi:hypothetical protein